MLIEGTKIRLMKEIQGFEILKHQLLAMIQMSLNTIKVLSYV
ncbi:TPA: hypothetical protein ACGI4I_002575 [Clostridioides difficile]|nr:hypothetical protein [Clostridioides difficile]MDW0069301.1 hypothetical protein [Clostridioides difficile]SJP36343.1 Uncharacterised protein [Clostridioides difficile]